MKGIHIRNTFRIFKYKLRGYSFGKNVYIGKGTQIEGHKVHIGNDVHIGKNVRIRANEINVGDNCLFFDNVDVMVNNKFVLGKRCKISRNTVFRANNVLVGEELWCNEGVEIGGGGWKKSTADLFLGSNVHLGKNVMINVCQNVTIGNRTGIGIETIILTHSSGHGQSVLLGYEHREKSVSIGNNVSVYSRAFITPGTEIKDGVVLGAMSYARGVLDAKCLYIGMPAKKTMMFFEMPIDVQYKKLKSLMEKELSLPFMTVGKTDIMLYQSVDEGRQYAVVLWSESDDIMLNADFQTLETVSICVVNVLGNNYEGNLSCEFDLKNLIMTGKTTFMSEKLRDIFRRYGLIFERRDYEPYLLDSNDFRKSGIEI